MSQPQWVKDYNKTDFNRDYPTDRESGPGPKTKHWYAISRNWMKKFLAEGFHVKPENILWSRGYFEWTMFAKIGEQWWYFSTGDIRHTCTNSMLVRKAKHQKDYTGGSNCFVSYSNPKFTEELMSILDYGFQSGQNSMANCYWRADAR